MTTSKRKALARAPKPKDKKYLEQLKLNYGIRKAIVDLSILIEKRSENRNGGRL